MVNQARWVLSGLLPILVGCSAGGGSDPAAPVASTPAPPPPPVSSSAPATMAVPSSFQDQAVLWGMSHNYAYSDDVGVMVSRFSGGGASGDVDGDGDLDVFTVGGANHPNRLYLNTGNSSFVEGAAAAGIAWTKGPSENYDHSGPVLVDLDGDRDLDLFLGGLRGSPTMIFVNDGAGNFTDATTGSGFENMTSEDTISAAFGDYDLDGDLDLAMAHWGTPRDADFPGETETLWRNDTANGVIRFKKNSDQSGVGTSLELASSGGVRGPDHDYSFAPSFVDLDGDRYPELLMVADFGTSAVLRNKRDGTFEDLTDRQVITDTNGMGSAVGDYDGDGDFDWFVSSINGNRLYENIGGDFEQSAVLADVEIGGWGWGSCFADFNGDGRLDIYQTNGWFTGEPENVSEYTTDPTRLWSQNSDGSFTDLAEASGVQDREQGRAVICDDFDDDGDMDALLLADEVQQQQFLWINQLADHNYLKVRLRGAAPNTQAVGARVVVTTGALAQHRLVDLNSNFTAVNSTDQLFGLGDAEGIDGVRIIWPDGQETIIEQPSLNSTLVVSHPTL